MREVKFDKIKAGDLVQVPRTQFAPMRYGWNGWLFSEAIVIEKGIGSKNKKPVIKVEMCIPKGRNQYKTVNKVFMANCVFETFAASNAKRIMREDGISNKNEFQEYISREDVTGSEWIAFLVDRGFVFDDLDVGNSKPGKEK